MPTSPAATHKAPAKADARQPIDALQDALTDLDEARRLAAGELRTRLDEAVDRLRNAVGDLRDRAAGEVRDLEASIDRANDEVRVELAVRAIRAQESPEALRRLSSEIRQRKAELTA